MDFHQVYPQIRVIQDLAAQKSVKVFLVGGFPRDALLHRECHDFDFAVEAGAISLAKSFAKKIKGAFVLLDEAHGCARVVMKEKDLIVTFDFADFRGKTFKDDLAHRDFTINTFSIELSKLNSEENLQNDLLCSRRAQKDLSEKRIRMASVKAFQEDPLRLMRGFSLQAQLGFRIEPITLKQMKKDRELLLQVAMERVRDELFKVLESTRTYLCFKAMDRMGLLEKVLPQITVMYGCQQGGYHHLDVWKHSLEVVGQLEALGQEIEETPDLRRYFQQQIGGGHSRWALVKLAALLHDIGKPQTRKLEGERMSFHSHEHVGRGITRAMAKQLKLSTAERYALEDMVLFHLRPGYLSNFKRPSERAFFRYFYATKNEAVSIALLSLADQRATRGPLTSIQDQAHHEKICRDISGRYFEKQKEKPFVRLIDGNDLIKQLKLSPSPLFGQILARVEEEQGTGKIATKSEALQLAKEIAEKIKE